MSTSTHVDALQDKHATLEKIINEEIQRPHPDSLKLTELKREKLKVKEEIVQLTRH